MTNRLAIFGLLLLAALSTGCLNTGRQKGRSPAELAEATTFWEPYLLYTSSNRYPKLYVEIDTIEGAKLPEERINALHKFLATYCDKPGGIELVNDDPIPIEHARGRGTNSLCLEYMRGPPDEQQAYMYILFYDSKLAGLKKRNPVAQLLPYPAAIMIDRRYQNYSARSIRQAHTLFLLHEAAHLLGMTRNTDHSDGLHCTNEKCFNHEKIYYSFSAALLRRNAIKQHHMCNDCIKDLAAYRRTPPPDNLSFVGRYLLRDETDYQVLTLPGYVYVHAGPRERLDLEDVDLGRRKTYEDGDASGIRYYISGLRSDAERVLPLLADDPYGFIRNTFKDIAIPAE